MNLLNSIEQQAKQIISEFDQENSIEKLSAKLNAILPAEQGQIQIFSNSIIASKKQQSILVYIDLMVQDIRQQQYTYSYLIEKPITSQSEIIVIKYGLNQSQQIFDKLSSDAFYPVMDSGEIVICQSQKYQSSWLKNWGSKQSQPINNFKLIVSGNNFKLGQQVRALCLYNPKNQYLYFIRNTTEQQMLKNKLNHALCADKQKIQSPKEIKNKFISLLSKIVSKNYALTVLFSIITPESFFIDGPNIYQSLKQVLPRVCHMKIKAPFKDSFFPFKNQEGQLVNTPFQFSIQKTFVIIDFNQFTKENQIKIVAEQIDNLKALKIFVEQGQSVYRWQYGQSLFPHNHSGIIVKASSILSPHFKSYRQKQLKMQQKQQPILTSNVFQHLKQQQLTQIRTYIEKCSNYNPKLDNTVQQQIQKLIAQQRSNNPQMKMDIQNRVKFAQLNAMSEWRTQIQVEDYLIANKIVMGQ